MTRWLNKQSEHLGVAGRFLGLWMLLVGLAACADSAPAPSIDDAPVGISVAEPTPMPTPMPQVEPPEVQALTNVNIRRGPGLDFEKVGLLPSGGTAIYLETSTDGQWWGISCPDDNAEICWVSAAGDLTELVGTPEEPVALPAPATSVQASVSANEIVVDNQDAEFSTAGSWFIGDGGLSYNGDCAWAPRGIQNIAYFRPQLPQAGTYEVFGWWCGDPNHDQSRQAHIEIHSTTATSAPHQVTVDLQESAGQWNSLGVYYLDADAMVLVAGDLNGNVVADAVRFVYRSAEPVVIIPTPAPTPVPWTNHPPSPLEQLTSGDLSARLGIVQAFYPHTPIVASVEMEFDDCQAFLRSGCGGTRPGWRVLVQYQEMVVPYRVSNDYRLVALDAPPDLANRQMLYLSGVEEGRFFRVDRYPMDGAWHLSAVETDSGAASYTPLGADYVETLTQLAQTYGPIVYTAPGGMELRLYGLGASVALDDADEIKLSALAENLAAMVWLDQQESVVIINYFDRTVNGKEII